MKSILIGLLLAGCFALFGPLASGDPGAPGVVTISHFSGKPVPRYERLRASRVYGRSGPSQKYPILWQYERKGLPVLVLKESIDWRRVRDPDGDEVWIHRNLLAGGSTALLLQDAELLRRPDTTAPVVARAERGVIAGLLTCERAWCRIGVDGREGWLPRTALWGAEYAGDAL